MSRKLIKENVPATKGLLASMYQYLKDILSICISIYMLLVIVLLPLYHQKSYYRIASDKLVVFARIIRLFLPVAAVFLISGTVLLLHNNRMNRGKWKAFAASLSITDRFVLGFFISVLLSYLFTDYPADALWGEERWLMGLLPQLTVIGAYFILTRSWNITLWIPGMLFPVSAVVFLLGLLDRFGVILIPMEYRNPQFISTVGNINWYCGYMVTFFFGAVYLYWSGAVLKKWLRTALLVYLGLGFATLVTQGSSSGLLALLGILFVLFLLSARHSDRMYAFSHIALLLSGTCLLLYLLQLLFPDAITYRESATELLTNTPLPAVMFLLSGLLLFWLYLRAGSYPKRFFTGLAVLVSAAALLFTAGFCALLIANTVRPGSIGALSDLSFLRFTPEWGSKRGATWTAGLGCYLEMSPGRKLVGAGPDCMWPYIAGEGSVRLRSLISQQFGNLQLTNAHNEWITVLVNYGLFGLISFAGMMICSIRRFLRPGAMPYPYACMAGACGISLLAYTLHNVVSFQQLMNYPLMFLILGIGEALLREKRQAKAPSGRMEH